MKPMEIVPGLILGGLGDLDVMLAMRPDALFPLDRLPGRVWQTGFRGEIVYYPVTDREVLPDDVLDVLVGAIVSRVRAGKKVALFCLGGHGRTGYVAACALHRLGVAEPMPFLWERYSAAAVETELQAMAVARFCERHAGQAMTIEIMGQSAAVAAAASARERTAVISITATDDPDIAFPVNENLAAVLPLKLNDLTEAFDEAGVPYGRPLPEQADFDGLKAFVDALDCARLIVHCWEGASRSAAVAAAVHAYRGGADILKTHARFAPNPRVYALACRALGVPARRPDYAAVPDGGGAWTLERRQA